MFFEYVEIHFGMKNINACYLDMLKFISCILIFKSWNSFGIEETPLECKETNFVISDTNNHQSSFIKVCEVGGLEWLESYRMRELIEVLFISYLVHI